MYVHTHAHAASASQPLFSRAVHPAQRKVPLIERRKRKAPAALNLEQLPPFRRRNPKHACVLTAPPTHVRIATAPAGPYHTLHRCVDVHTRELFFYPEYTGPPGEEKKRAVQWPSVIELSSPVARSGAETLREAESGSSDTRSASCDRHGSMPGCVQSGDGKTDAEAHTGEHAAEVSLLERRKRKALSPLRLDVIPPFKRRNTTQMCVLEAPATHVRLHAVQAGPHHVMHQCIDAHTAEVFFYPEYVGPSGEESSHHVSWPQIINPAAKPADHESDVPFEETLEVSPGNVGAGGVGGVEEVCGSQSGDVDQARCAGSAPSLCSASTYVSTTLTASCFSPSSPSAEDNLEVVSSCAAPEFEGGSVAEQATKPTKQATKATQPSVDHSSHNMASAVAEVECCKATVQGFVTASNGGAPVHGTGTIPSASSGIDASTGGQGSSTCSPGTPCNVAVATASLAARAVKVN